MMATQTALGEIQPRTLSQESMVLQHNGLARGTYENVLQIDDIRLFNAAIAKLEKDADVLGDVVITASEMRKVFPDYARNNRYAEKINQASDRLMGMIAKIHLGKNHWEKITLFHKTRYERGQVTFQFHEESKGVILRVGAGNYTSYRVKAISNLKTTPQVLLYQWARSYAHIGSWEASSQLVRSVLNTKAGTYPREAKFTAVVLGPAVEFINNDEATDILISYQPVKGRNHVTVAYRFRVSLKESAQLTISDEVAIEFLIQAGISKTVATRAVRDLGGTTCIGMLSHTRWRESKLPKLESAARYLGKLLAEGISIPVENPDHKRVHEGLLLSTRLRIFERLEPDAKKAHLDAFSATLTGRAKLDWEVHKNPSATSNLVQLWHRYVMNFVANAEGAIVITKVKTTLAARLDGSRDSPAPVHGSETKALPKVKLRSAIDSGV